MFITVYISYTSLLFVVICAFCKVQWRFIWMQIKAWSLKSSSKKYIMPNKTPMQNIYFTKFIESVLKKHYKQLTIVSLLYEVCVTKGFALLFMLPHVRRIGYKKTKNYSQIFM